MISKHWSPPVLFQGLFLKAYKTIAQDFERSRCVCEEERESECRVGLLTMLTRENSDGERLWKAYDLRSTRMKQHILL